ncbi:unnamed protein product [Paramecium pentaurelia]|uniref:EGF-like domain-containing protein n=1 Tax=Paramecium pentaurelia TaxID=43138 RepID=A0A8S1X7K0_9CILI|nr:unnamed protein product [Paramecium pentaurelia]
MIIFQPCVSQWLLVAEYYCQNQKFQNLVNVGGFNFPSQPKTAYFIDCIIPTIISLITLNSQNPILISENEIEFINQDQITLDLYFQDIWIDGNIKIKIGNEIFTVQYSSPQQYPIASGFCDNLKTEIKTVSFTLSSSQKSKMELQMTNTNNNGKVSIKNLQISRLQCYPLCISCTGAAHNQCTSCQSGSPENNRCPMCPANQVFMPNIGCTQYCHFDYRQTYEKICVYFKTSTIYVEQLYPNEKRFTTMIADIIAKPLFDQVQASQQHGIYIKNSGFIRFIYLSSFDQGILLLGIQLTFTLYDSIPVGGKIEFKINGTYFGSIYQTDQGTQFHRVSMYQQEQFNCIDYWTTCQTLGVFMFVDIPKYSFSLTVFGNYQNSNAAWSLRELKISSGQCQDNCKYCELPYICQICDEGLYVSSDGNCVKCEEYYQVINGNSCIDYDNETPYSQFLIKNEYFSKINDPSQSSQYVLVSQESINFLKGSNIFYSIWQGKQIFGGQYIWSQAKFQITHQIQKPHHSVTIVFYILYGPNFPLDSQFIYTLESNEPIIKSRASATLSFSDATVSEKVILTKKHSSDTLTLYWECKGSNNNPESAYCGIYGYNVVVHYCSPYCLECLNEITCTKWDNSVDVKFHQQEGCLTKSYYNKQEQQCLSCPETCRTCTSEFICQSCELTLTLIKKRCSCLMNQYFANNQCYECPIGCNQCVNDQVCVECLTADNRELINGKCECLAGYYSINSNPVCQKCHSQQTCNCQFGTSYDSTSNSCKACHSTCESCFRLSIDGCLTCNINNKRILKGLKCVCMPGYYELNGVCQSCPTIENTSLVQCYKICDAGMSIWHTQICTKCDLGFQLVYGQCMPKCGDFLVEGYEQCEDGNNDLNDLCFNCQYQCPSDCTTCTSTTTLPCQGYCGDGIVNGTEECDDGNQIQFDGCHNCKFQCSSNCINCVKGKCTHCVTKKYTTSFTMSSENCLLQCGFGDLIQSDSCINDTSNDIDQCQNCRFNCRSNCSNCDYKTGTCLQCDLPGFKPYSNSCKNICGNNIIDQDPTNFFTENCDDSNIINGDLCSSVCKIECQDPEICTDCRNTRCYACGIGYYLNDQYSCYSKCGDVIVAKDEICDIALPYRGCLNCKPKCQNSCLNCSTLGKGCLECQQGYQNIDNMCKTICGDGFVTADEQCDDGNLIFDDGCHQCLKTCTIGCSVCDFGVCLDCYEGFQFVKNQCIKINEKYHDPRCDSNCLNCSIEGHGCLQCKIGFDKIDNKCHSICGDQQVVEPEQCDDEDLDFNDGCHQCLYDCPISCEQNFCYLGLCYGCKKGFLYHKNNCYSNIENDYLAEPPKFYYSDLVINQSFSSQILLTKKIEVKCSEFPDKQVFYMKGQYAESAFINQTFFNLEVDLSCSQNQNLNIQLNNFDYEQGFDKQSVIFGYQCHNTFNHAIKLQFRINRIDEEIKRKDEILVIIITENQFKLSLIVRDFLQNLFSFKFLDS